jgi:hypothetical protein
MKVRYWIEGSAVIPGGYQGEFELDDAELAGLDADERQSAIVAAVQAEVDNAVQWGWEAGEPLLSSTGDDRGSGDNG